jgi:single-strand DNA-binding protein
VFIMLNRAELIGRLGRDPEMRYTAGGKAMAHLALATSEFYKDRDTGQRQEHTEWHRVVLFGRTAEIAQAFLKKGALVYLDGRLRTRKWQNAAGQDQYTTEVVGSVLTFLERKPAAASAETDGTASAAPEDSGFEDDLEDLPF